MRYEVSIEEPRSGGLRPFGQWKIWKMKHTLPIYYKKPLLFSLKTAAWGYVFVVSIEIWGSGTSDLVMASAHSRTTMKQDCKECKAGASAPPWLVFTLKLRSVRKKLPMGPHLLHFSEYTGDANLKRIISRSCHPHNSSLHSQSSANSALNQLHVPFLIPSNLLSSCHVWMNP